MIGVNLFRDEFQALRMETARYLLAGIMARGARPHGDRAELAVREAVDIADALLDEFGISNPDSIDP